MYRTLKTTGSFYLHCDWHADAYIRVGILDKIFGAKNFINCISWNYKTGGVGKKWFGRKHDSIFLYSKSKKYTFNPIEIKEYYFKKPSFEDRKGGVDKNGYYRITYASDSFDIPAVFNMSNEYIGYPTQKPEALLERIIKASTNEGDVVMDCFCGGGTTIAVANKLNRKFIGIDQSVSAIKVTEARLNNQAGLFSESFLVKLHKYDYDTIRYSDAFAFESWIVSQFGGEINAKQRGDMGLDGKKNGSPIQVKRSDNVGRNVVDNFKSAISRFYGQEFTKIKKDKEIDGYIIAFSFSKGAYEEIARLKNEEGLIIKLVEVAEIIPIAKKPKLIIEFSDLGIDEKNQRIIEFIAKTESKIELYQWCFNYNEQENFKADVLIDKEGKQTEKFLVGEYVIACKVIDTEGISAIETVKLKINGDIKKLNSY